MKNVGMNQKILRYKSKFGGELKILATDYDDEDNYIKLDVTIETSPGGEDLEGFKASVALAMTAQIEGGFEVILRANHRYENSIRAYLTAALGSPTEKAKLAELIRAAGVH